MGGEGDAEWLSAWNSRAGQSAVNNGQKQAGFYVNVDHDTGAVSTPAESITEDTAIQQVQMVESIVRPRAALFVGDLTSLMTPPPWMQQFWVEAEALKASGASRHAIEVLWKKYVGEAVQDPQ